jgi:predicted nuclease of predicted toxin-antitoxin system
VKRNFAYQKQNVEIYNTAKSDFTVVYTADSDQAVETKLVWVKCKLL